MLRGNSLRQTVVNGGANMRQVFSTMSLLLAVCGRPGCGAPSGPATTLCPPITAQAQRCPDEGKKYCGAPKHLPCFGI